MVLHHLTGQGMMLAAYSNGFFRGGYLAVTTFFVLSGFVLTRGYGRAGWDAPTLKRYYLARGLRVYPVYLLSLLVVAPFIALDPTPAKGAWIAMHVALVQGWFGSLPVNWNTPAWSLSCEMFFYAVFPLIVATVPRRGWRGTLLLAAFATCLTRILWRVGVSDGVKPLIHVSDFLMGIAAASAYELLLKRRVRGSWLYLPAGALILALVATQPAGLDITTTLRPLNALLLIGLALGGGPVARLLAVPPVEFLGRASYALYILHVPLLWWYLRFVKHPSAAVFLIGSVAISALTYRFLEKPLSSLNSAQKPKWGRLQSAAGFSPLGPKSG